MPRDPRDFWTPLGLTALTLLAYCRLFQNDFVCFDDDRYVSQNPIVQQGLTVDGFLYAWTTWETGNWIPLTWLSLQADAAWGGTAAWPFLVTNLLLHLVNVLLIYAVLRRLGMAWGICGTVAAVFAVHPLHVESVAWIAERKDVLSTCFLLLALLQYLSCVKSPAPGRFLGVMALFVCGLLAKPMLVTFPLLLLLLDFWPLQRWKGADAHSGWRVFGRLLWEKFPLLIISCGFGLVAVLAQHSEAALAEVAAVSLAERVLNASHSLVWYLWKTCLPISLCSFYPFPAQPISVGGGVAALGILSGVSLIACWRRAAQPWIFVGWGWYVIALLPVSGLVQVGEQAHADRYAYVPQLGLLVFIVAVAAQFARSRKFVRIPLTAVTAVWIAALTGQTLLQVATWRNPDVLWSHALQVVPGNWMAHYQLGRRALLAGELDAARFHAAEAEQRHPLSPSVLSLRGRIEQSGGHWLAAAEAYHQALRLHEKNRDALLGMIAVTHARGDSAAASAMLESYCNQNPRDCYARTQWGLLLAERQEWDQARAQFDTVIRCNPRGVEAYRLASHVLTRTGDFTEAQTYLHRALQLAPGDPQSLAQLQKLQRQAGSGIPGH